MVGRNRSDAHPLGRTRSDGDCNDAVRSGGHDTYDAHVKGGEAEAHVEGLRVYFLDLRHVLPSHEERLYGVLACDLPQRNDLPVLLFEEERAGFSTLYAPFHHA